MKRPMFKLTTFPVACWLAIGSGGVLAEDCYKMIHGKHNPVCRKLGQNFNRFCDKPPMRRDIAIHPDFAKDFSYPKWESIDPLANIELIAEVVRSGEPFRYDCTGECDSDRREYQWQRTRPKLLNSIRHGCVHFSRARFDINHDGKKELVYRLRGNDCPSSNDSWPGYVDGMPGMMVLDEATEKFDRGFVNDLKWPSDVIFHLGRVSIVKYDAFDDTWSVLESASSQGIPFVVFPNPVCKYQITDQGRNK